MKPITMLSVAVAVFLGVLSLDAVGKDGYEDRKCCISGPCDANCVPTNTVLGMRWLKCTQESADVLKCRDPGLALGEFGCDRGPGLTQDCCAWFSGGRQYTDSACTQPESLVDIAAKSCQDWGDACN